MIERDTIFKYWETDILRHKKIPEAISRGLVSAKKKSIIGKKISPRLPKTSV